MLNRIILFASKKFPFLGNFYRYAYLLVHWILPKKKSYSQHHEDYYIYLFLKDYLIKGHVGYIDVGGNHPTRINNTYLFYRNGYNGIVFEPNNIYKNMYRLCRNKDVFFPYGCSDKCDLLKFNYSPTPVLSSFESERFVKNKTNVKTAYLPVFSLDHILERIDVKYNSIPLLSIDTEGYNMNVLRGATSILKDVVSVLIEFDNAKDKDEITEFLHQHGFLLEKSYGCNLFFINSILIKNEEKG